MFNNYIKPIKILTRFIANKLKIINKYINSININKITNSNGSIIEIIVFLLKLEPNNQFI